MYNSCSLSRYFWKRQNDSNINLRFLKNAYLYPERTLDYGEWLLNFSRPIILHVTKTSPKLIKNEAEIQVLNTNNICLDQFIQPKVIYRLPFSLYISYDNKNI